jgi:hypothetical protein
MTQTQFLGDRRHAPVCRLTSCGPPRWRCSPSQRFVAVVRALSAATSATFQDADFRSRSRSPVVAPVPHVIRREL